MIKKERLYWLDTAKSAGIFLVIIGHTLLPYNQEYIRNIIYSFHIPLFFILSGMLHRDSTDIETSIKQNFKSLIIPYLLFNILVFLIFFLPKALIYQDFITLGINPLKCMLEGQEGMPAATCWFLLALFIIKLIFHFSRKNQLVLLLSCILLPAIGYLLHNTYHIHLYYFINQSLISYPFFVIGYMTNKYHIYQKIKRIHLLYILPLVIILLIINQEQGFVDLFFCDLGSNIFLYYTESLIGSFALILFCIVVMNKPNKFTKTVSTGTIFIFVTHQQFYNDLNKALNKLFPDIYQPSILFSILFALSYIFVSYLIIPYLMPRFPALFGGRKLK